MDEPVVTGTDILRRTVHARNRSPHTLSLIVREIDGVGASTLEDFAAGKADLSVEALKALTKVLYPRSEFDVESGMLRSANKTAISMPANYPPPLGDPTLWPTYRGPRQPGEQPSNVLPPSPPPRKKRAGWL